MAVGLQRIAGAAMLRLGRGGTGSNRRTREEAVAVIAV